ncbi:hypothetical protein DIZ81_07425 [Legionella taurinensis]|uniref:Uncharacterized protein n=1 Tax=Legionella taurinensis TaxID=70611 RepID=A0A3A5LC50_9GAMM|nr:hypothetical protein [Legionella taurinensis]MDX1837097.1 hypothetical protein [Legionella taurinensis]PUT40417.1 hypothetical protein DB744_07425 [Legionella taurinensis]PUT40491.1 hypothetical protein DB746_11415 [Legionella taurinensis]PUT42736.1 hypothetical protein DB743_11900 [Legionella taurinensis]PUT48479.1 hypothetical protein DB745_05825 [Legionella taurinensis]
MLEKFEKKDNKKTGTNQTYSSYIKLDQIIVLSRNWINHKEAFLDAPCKTRFRSIYSIAKIIDDQHPLPLMMPEVHFDENYSSNAYETWEELYLKDDVFVSLDNLKGKKYIAYSLETVYLANKYKGFLRTTLHFDDVEATEMSERDQERFLSQLKKRYPEYYKEYLNVQPNKAELSLTSIGKEKLNAILDAVEVMLVLSCQKGGLTSNFLPGGLTDALSSYGYQLLIQVLSDTLSPEEKKGLDYLWAKNIQTNAERTVGDLINSALHGSCTTTLGLYWLGLLKTLRPQLTLAIDEKFVDKIYNDLVQDRTSGWSNLGKAHLTVFLKKNAQYIILDMLNPVEKESQPKVIPGYFM